MTVSHINLLTLLEFYKDTLRAFHRKSYIFNIKLLKNPDLAPNGNVYVRQESLLIYSSDSVAIKITISTYTYTRFVLD